MYLDIHLTREIIVSRIPQPPTVDEVEAHEVDPAREGFLTGNQKSATCCAAPADAVWVTGPGAERAEHDAAATSDACCAPAPRTGAAPGNVDQDDAAGLRDAVRRRYAAAALEAASAVGASCCGPASCCSPATINTGNVDGHAIWGSALYESVDQDAAPAAITASLGCGVPTAVADLHPGDVVLDLGSGAGADVLIAARRVAPGGRAIGLDMTPEMLELARRNAATAGVDNVEFLEGYLEDVPLPRSSVDVVISNCVINLAADKRVVLREAARVLRPGGRFAISDVIADPGMDAATRADMAAWTGCIGGAITEDEYREALSDAGFEDIEITETHRVHAHAVAAIVRARHSATDQPRA